MENRKLDKVVRLGTTLPEWKKKAFSVYVHITYKDGRLSISGVEGPLKSGNARGGCGQIDKPIIDSFSPDMNQVKLDTLFEIWEAFHLNDLQAGCEHQRLFGWNKRHLSDGRYAGHVYQRENSDGILCKPCPICGYKYGTKWLSMDVPSWAIDYLESLPDTDIQPAWY